MLPCTDSIINAHGPQSKCSVYILGHGHTISLTVFSNAVKGKAESLKKMKT